MSITVTCPSCQSHFEITDDLADLPIRCARCAHTFERNGQADDVHAAGIQAGTKTKTAPAKKPLEDDPPPLRYKRPSSPRSPFPVTPLLIVTIGLLLLLLILSAGFNVWFVAHPDEPFRGINQAREAEERARQMQMQAQIAAEQARVLQQQEAEKKEAALKRRLRELEVQVDALNKQLDEAKRK